MLSHQLLESRLLFIRALSVRPRAETIRERATGRLVVARRDDVPTLVDRTHEARAHVAELAVRLRGIGPFAFHSAGVDPTIAASGICL